MTNDDFQPSLFDDLDGDDDASDEPRDRPNCPICSEKMKRVMYGFPSGPPPEDADYVLGGCVIFPGQAKFVCPPCDAKFDEIVDGLGKK